MNYCDNCNGYILGYDELDPVGMNECQCKKEDIRVRGMEGE